MTGLEKEEVHFKPGGKARVYHMEKEHLAEDTGAQHIYGLEEGRRASKREILLRPMGLSLMQSIGGDDSLPIHLLYC